MACPANLKRRNFIKKAVFTAAAGLSFPEIIPAEIISGKSRFLPNNRLNLGFIGVGSHGTNVNLKNFLGMQNTQVVAVCDADSKHLLNARQITEEYYSGKIGKKYTGCATAKDFREVISRPGVDAVVISTPDHWHVPIAAAAVKAGKDVYCEKPLTLTIQEGRLLSDVVKKHKAVFQTGSEFRGAFNFHRAAELVRNGRIGKLKEIHTFLPSNPHEPGDPTPMPVPAELDYDMWLGPAPFQPYTRQRVHFNFRWILDYSGGQLTDWGAHLNDQAQWANDSEMSGPVEIEGSGVFREQGLFDTAHRFKIKYTYQNGVRLICTDLYPQLSGGIRYIGTEGTVFARYSGYQGRAINADPPGILSSEIQPEETHLYTCPAGPEQNFIDCVISRKEPYYPVEIGHRSATVCHLGNIAMLLGRKLKWDPEQEIFLNDDDANRLRTRQSRLPLSA